MGPAAGARAGVLVGGLLVAALVLARPVPDPPRPAAPGASAEAFLAAWRLSRTATFVTAGTYTRLIDGRPALATPTRTVQRPPDRLVAGPGSVQGRLDGRRLGCALVVDGDARCRVGEPVGPYASAVDHEVSILVRQVIGDGRLYAVSDDGPGCFALRLERAVPDAPYGRRARFCFDGSSGALVSSRIDRGRAVDLVEISEVRVAVTEDDLEPPTHRPRS